MNRIRAIAVGSKSGYEEARINALTRYRIAGTPPEEIFDHYVQMATLIFRIPAAIIAFAGSDLVHYKASIGVGGAENNQRYGINCLETIESEDDVHIVDMAMAGNHIAATNGANANYTYYAGTPIVTPDGYAIGCLSLLDHKFHKLGAEQLSVLKILAAAVMDAVEERLHNLQDRERNQWFSKTTQEGMWEWDIYQDKIWWNSGFSILFGYPPVNNNHYDLDFWCNNFDEADCENIKEIMQSYNMDGEYLFKKADGALAHVLIRSVIIRDDFGHPVKIIGSMLDISERFKNEELNRKANQDLMRNKDEFISIASHEIKTPITIIKSYSQIIRKEAERDVYQNTNLNSYAERIQKQSDKLLKLVENLLDVSRINTGKMVIYPETFDFIKLLEQTLDELDADTGSHVIEKLGDVPLRVYGDEFRIGQVLTNLITNAIKYSPGADKIIISYHKNIEANSAIISIQDFGKGIAKCDQEKLFQKFHRIINLHENQISGTGLGLSIAMEIMKQHGSIITLKSEEGKGSIFSFELMLSPAFSSHI
jgi:two-component system CheB/CheR fusion protein